jgi:tripeptidyl-peptidase-1
VALINDARLQAGQPVLGFLNPWLYRNMALFNDIKQGSSGGACAGGKGWPATAGNSPSGIFHIIITFIWQAGTLSQEWAR